MRSNRWIEGLIGALALALGSLPVHAQRPPAGGKPSTSPPAANETRRDEVTEATARAMFELAKVGARDYVVDLGSPNGLLAMTAARDFAARATGLAPDPATVESLRKLAAGAGLAARVQFRRADLFATQFPLDYSSASVVAIALKPDVMQRLRTQMLEMTPGTRIVAAAQGFGDWPPDAQAVAGTTTIHLWTVPARLEGTWLLQQPERSMLLDWTQRYQKVGAVARATEPPVKIIDAKLHGDRLEFSLEEADGKRAHYSGQVTGRQMQGTLKLPGAAEPLKWSAARR